MARVSKPNPLRSNMFQSIMQAAVVISMLAGGGCAVFSPEAGIGSATSWGRLAGWREDELIQAWEALAQQCDSASDKTAVVVWCEAADELQTEPRREEIRAFFESRAKPYRLHGSYGRRDGLVTGYYEPLLMGSRHPDERFRYPLYQVPEELLVVELGELFPELQGKRVRGRVENGKVLPFYPREHIDSEQQPLAGQELFWVDDAVDAFFLQIQGSGIVQLPDGSRHGVAYAQQNGHPYRAIGRDLVDQGEIPLEDISLFSIRDWLDANPDKAQELMNRNPSYVFFKDAGPATAEGPDGSLGVPLTAERSVAVDRSIVPLGSPLWLETTLPDGSHYRRLVFAQDTGGAIAGAVRADVFFGRGARAEQLAGTMKQTGRLYLIQLNDDL
ncbi:MAG: murein transglycosylase A [Granulosicoccaceae bacterium]